MTLSLLFAAACSEEEADSDECYTDDDCPAGQVCIITHDHEGDDHDHGGDCEASDTAGSWARHSQPVGWAPVYGRGGTACLRVEPESSAPLHPVVLRLSGHARAGSGAGLLGASLGMRVGGGVGLGPEAHAVRTGFPPDWSL